MTQRDEGQVVTFYSYKGGTGRTMALANTAWILAANGRRVLVADWDLESPGLHRFLAPFLDPEQVSTTGGVMDLILEYEWATTPTGEESRRHGGVPAPSARPPDWHRQFAKVEKYAFSVAWDFPGGGTLDILLAGRHNPDYATNVTNLSWDNFYNRLGGAQFFDALREDMKDRYDYTLIDSRTGLSDVADICTIHLPDVIVDCFTLSDQGIDGAAAVAKRIRTYDGRRLRRVLPVPMRVDEGEKGKADAGRALAMRHFAGLPSGMTDAERRDYWLGVEVPYKTYYAYEEMLATFGDQPGSRTSLLSAYETLAGHLTDGRITSLPGMDEALRRQTVARFERKPALADEVFVLRYVPEDQAWAEWVRAVLTGAKLRVIDAAAAGPGGAPTRGVALISQSYLAAQEEQLGRAGRRRADASTVALYVDNTVPLADFPFESWAALDGLTADQAVEQVLLVAGRGPGVGDPVRQESLPRFPGNQPAVFNPPARNLRFTGREQLLLELRQKLKAAGGLGTPVALHGGAGVGKTQLAFEYAHRFRGAYDVVWWISATQPQFIDVAMADLGAKLRLPVRPTIPENMEVVKRWLSRAGSRTDAAGPTRWLLILDNADKYEDVRDFLPQGSGHVLVTTLNPDWADVARMVSVDVFQQAESVEHLRARVGRRVITAAEAEQVAAAVGHLPILVATAGAWLADTATPAAGFLATLERAGPVRDQVKQVWNLSLQRLRQGSPGAYRLLQLASVLESEISLDLLYSDQVAKIIAGYDDEIARQLADRVSERDIAASLVQRINKLALIKVDNAARRVQIHRLLQGTLRDLMSEDELAGLRHDVHLMLAGSRPPGEVDDPAHQDRFRILWPHLDGSDAVLCPDDSVRELVTDRIRYIWLLGGYEQGIEYAERADRAWSALLAEHPGTGEHRSLLMRLLHLRFIQGNLLRSMGRFEAARLLDEDTLRRQEDLIGADHPHTLMTAGGYGGDLRALGRYRDALERDLRTHRMSAARFGEEHRRTLVFANNLAASYRLMGDFHRALEVDRSTYHRMRAVFGESHPRTLLSAGNLGRDLREAGEYEASVTLLHTVRADYQDLYGEHSRDAMKEQASLAASMRGAGAIDDAARLLDEAYARLNAGFGAMSPDTVFCRLGRAANLMLQGAGGVARTELIEIEKICMRLFGEEHPYVLVCRNNLAVAMWDGGDVADAHALAVATAASLEAILGERHPFAMAASNNLAVFTIQGGEPAAGLARLAAVVDRLRNVLTEEHPDYLRGRGNLAIAQEAVGSASGSIVRMQIADDLANRIGAHHPSVVGLRDGRYVRRILDPHPY
jgi:tetratricopeptide (TPR) repeat protein